MDSKEAMFRTSYQRFKSPFYGTALLLLLILLSPVSVTGLNQIIQFENIKLYKGQQRIDVHDILQDSIGYIWFASTKGLFRYDGYQFKRFTPDGNDSTSLPMLNVFKLALDPQQNLWLICRNILCKYDPITESFTCYPHNTRYNLGFYSITADEKYVWLGGYQGELYRFHKQSRQYDCIQLVDPRRYSSKSLIIRNMTVADSLLWITSSVGVYTLHLNTLEIRPLYQYFPEMERDYVPRVLLINKNRDIFFGVNQLILYQIKNNELNHYCFLDHSRSDKTPEDLFYENINSIAEDNQGNLWMATPSEGLIFFNMKTMRFKTSRLHPHILSGLPHLNYTVVFVDRSGTIWVNHAGEGLYRSNINPFRIRNYEHIFNPQDSCTNDFITNIAELSDGRLFLTIKNDGLLIFDPLYETFEFIKNFYTDIYNQYDNTVYDLLADKNDNIWLSVRNGLIEYNLQSSQFSVYEYTLFTKPKGNEIGYITSLHMKDDSTIWVGCDDGTLCEFNTRKKEVVGTHHNHYRQQDKNNQGYKAIFCIEKDQNGLIWLGTPLAGIFLFDPAKSEFVQHFHLHLPDNRANDQAIPVFDIMKSRDGRMWIATVRNGLIYYDDQTGDFVQFKDKEGMLSNNIHTILEDNLGNIWTGNAQGICLFDRKTEIFTPFCESENVLFHLLEKNNVDTEPGKSDQPRENTRIVKQKLFYSGRATGYITKNGLLYFGGANGFTIIDPHSFTDISAQNLSLTAFKIFNESVFFDKPIYAVNDINLSYKDYIFSFEFMLSDFSNIKNNQFAFWLQGFEKEWSYVGNVNRREYYNIPPGQYTFLAKARNSSGIWTPEPVAIHLTITPPFWKTWWFYLIVFIFLTSAVGSGIHLRFRYLQNQRKLLESQVQQRTRELSKTNQHLLKEIQYRQKVEEELRQSEEEYRDLFENAYDVIWISDMEGNIQAVNTYFQKLIGYPKDEIIGTNLLNYVCPEQRFRAIRYYLIFCRNHLLECELNFRTKNNGIRILWLKSRGIYEKGKIVGIHVIGRDSTDLRKAQTELQKAEQAKRDSIKQLILKIAHEIKNPLSSITSSAQLVASSKDYRSNEKIQRHMNIINKNVFFCNQVIRDLYLFTHRKDYTFRPFSIKEMIKALQEYAESKIESGSQITVKTQIAESLEDLIGDKFRLEQAFINLINNAIEAMPNKGTLTIKAFSDNGQVCIEIADTGCGIPEETLPNIYKSFYTSKTDGFGLGLPIVKDIVDAHRGDITVVSKHNAGTTFTIRLDKDFNPVSLN